MKICLVADLHGNRPATEAMEKAINAISPNEIWFLGDSVGKGPESAYTCDWVRNNCKVALAGNWDLGISGKHFHDEYYWNQLGEERMEYLSSLPLEKELLMSGVLFRLFHGRPVTELMNIRKPASELCQLFHTGKRDYGAIIFADSHKPFIRTTKYGYFINTGSVGNGIDIPKAHGLVLEGDYNTTKQTPLLMSILRVSYDNDRAVKIAMEDDLLPHRDAYVNEIKTGEYAKRVPPESTAENAKLL